MEIICSNSLLNKGYTETSLMHDYPGSVCFQQRKTDLFMWWSVPMADGLHGQEVPPDIYLESIALWFQHIGSGCAF